jgi:arginase
LNVIWLDAHGDFNTPETTPSGYLGGMVLAAALGRGAPELTSLGGTGPPVPDERVGLMAIRALDEEERASLDDSRVRFTVFERRDDLNRAVDAFLEETEGPVILHFDVDSVDPRDLPHVSFRAPGGPRVPEVRESLMSVAESGRLVALEVASLDATQKNAASSAALISGMVAETVAASQ